ncbi:MAG: hypothetical protein KW793_04330 [Candidatus Doudnabacteria bacterium]|nr:hypothetical protein [Candidatus Doudnabacteria bacterium]
MKTNTKKRRGEKYYPAQYLAIALAVVLLLEGFLMGVSTTQNWKTGLEILDLSSSVDSVMSDVYFAIEPMVDQYVSVTQFYQMAADEMMVMLDVSDSDPLAFFKGVNEFYQLASIEMEQMLDLSGDFQNAGRVAGAFISQ